MYFPSTFVLFYDFVEYWEDIQIQNTVIFLSLTIEKQLNRHLAPLLDSNGRLKGVDSSTLSCARTSVSLSLSHPVSTVLTLPLFLLLLLVLSD